MILLYLSKLPSPALKLLVYWETGLIYAIILVVLVVGVFVMRYFKSNLIDQALRVLGPLTVFHQYVLFVPFVKYSLFVVCGCMKTQWSNFNCSSNMETPYIVMAGLCLLIHTSFYAGSLLFVNNFYSSHNFLGKVTSKVSLMQIIFEGWLLVSQIIKKEIRTSRVILAPLAIDLLSGLYLAVLAQQNITYLRQCMKRLWTLLLALLLFLNFTIFSSTLIKLLSWGQSIQWEGLMCCIGSLFFIQMVITRQKQKYFHEFLCAMEDTKSDIKTLRNLIKVSLVFTDIKEEFLAKNKIHIFEKKIKPELIYLEAMIHRHQSGCQVKACPCRNPQIISQSDFYLLKKDTSKVPHSDTLILAGFLFNLRLLEVLNSTKLRASYSILYCLFLINFFKNYLKSIYFIKNALTLKLRAGEASMVYMMHRVLSDKIKKSNTKKNHIELIKEMNPIVPLKDSWEGPFEHFQRQRDSLDFEKVIMFEKELSKMNKLALEYGESQEKVWETVTADKSRKKAIGKLNKILNELESKNFKINQSLGRLERIFPNHFRACLMYGIMVSFLRNDLILGKRYVARSVTYNQGNLYKFVQRVLLPENQVSIEAVAVQAKVENNVSTITYITKGCKALFKESPEILTKQMIRVLMPRIYTSRHDGFVKNFVETGEPTILNRPFDSFARTSEDFIVPSKISTKLSPNILNGLQIVSMFTPIKDTIEMVCLCNEKGTIMDVSEKFSKVFNLKPKYFNTFGVNITYFSSKLKKVLEIFDKYYSLEIIAGVPESGNRLNKSVDLGDRSSMNERRPSGLMADKSLLDIENNRSVIAGSTHLNTFFMRAETVSQLGSQVNLKSNSALHEDHSMDSLRNLFGDDLEIVKNFESTQGGQILFKVPKAFIDNQNKKIMEKNRNEGLGQGGKPPSKRGGMNLTESRLTDEQKDRNLYTMLKIKVKFHRLLEKIRERMRKSTHYSIRARVQLIYLKHKNLIIKALVIRNIESSGWEKNEYKGKFLVNRSKLNIKGRVQQRNDTNRKSNNDTHSSLQRNESDAFQLTDKDNLKIQNNLRMDDISERMFKSIAIKNSIDQSKASSSDSHESRTSGENLLDEVLEGGLVNGLSKKGKAKPGLSKFNSSRGMDASGMKGDIKRRFSNKDKEAIKKKEELEAEMLLASNLNDQMKLPDEKNPEDLYSFCKQENVEESPTFKNKLDFHGSNKNSSSGASLMVDKESMPLDQGKAQKNFTFMNFSAQKSPESSFKKNQKSGMHLGDGEQQNNGGGSANIGSQSFDEKNQFLAGSGDIFDPNGDFTPHQITQNPFANVMFAPPLSTQARLLLGDNEGLSVFGVTRKGEDSTKKTGNFQLVMSNNEIVLEENQKNEEKAQDLHHSDIDNEFESLKHSSDGSKSKKEIKTLESPGNNSLTIRTPDHFVHHRLKSDLNDSRFGSSNQNSNGSKETRKKEETKSKFASAFNNNNGSPSKTLDEHIKNFSMTREPHLRNDISVDHVLNQYSEIQSDFLSNEKNKMEKLKNCLILVNSPFKPTALTHMIWFNHLSFMATFLVELIIPAISAYFAIIVGREFDLYTTTSTLIYLQLSTHIDLEILSSSIALNLNTSIYTDLGISNVTEWLIYDVLRQKKAVLFLEMTELKEDMISVGEESQIYFDFIGGISYLYSSLFSTIFLPWSEKTSKPVLDEGKLITIIEELEEKVKNSQSQFDLDKMIIYMWTPATYVLTVIIFAVLFLFLRKATKVKMSVLNIFFMIEKEEIRNMLSKHSKFKKILEYIMGYEEREDGAAPLEDEISEKLSVREAMNEAQSKKSIIEKEKQRKKHRNAMNELPGVKINYYKIAIVFFIYFLVQASGLLFKINAFTFHSRGNQMMENILRYFEVFISPACSTAEVLGVFQKGSCPEFQRGTVVMPNTDVYLENSKDEWEKLAEKLLTGEIPVCDYFTCPQDFEMDSLVEAFSFVNTTILQFGFMEDTSYSSLVRDPSQRAASTPFFFSLTGKIII